MADPNAFEDWRLLDRHTVTYHTLENGFELKVDILLPQDLTAANHALIIAYHGGGLVFGSRDHYDFQASWLPAWAAKNNAIILSPDYQLLPQSSASDIISTDIVKFWDWLHSSLSTEISRIMPPGHGIDLDRILVEGGSAGGFVAGHMALSYGHSIRASILVYPMLDGLYERGMPPQKMFPGQTLMPREQMLAELKAVQREPVPTVTRLPTGQNPNWGSSMLFDREAYSDVFGPQGNGLQPIDRISTSVRNAGEGLPDRTWILHGKDDTAVPCLYSERFVKKLEQCGWTDQFQVRLTIVDDEPSQHGFDMTWKADDEKLKKHLDWIEEVWLKI